MFVGEVVVDEDGGTGELERNDTGSMIWKVV
jgi:hypothetical protein